MKIELYSASWCSNCPAAKAVLEAAGVDYQVIDIDVNPEKAMEAGIRGIPTIIVGDERYVTATLGKLREQLKSLTQST